jgi:hypothetical protein
MHWVTVVDWGVVGCRSRERRSSRRRGIGGALGSFGFMSYLDYIEESGWL